MLPFVHRGMAVNLQKQDEKYVLPRPRVPIRILIGDPIRIEDVFDDNTLRNPEVCLYECWGVHAPNISRSTLRRTPRTIQNLPRKSITEISHDTLKMRSL